MIESLFETLEVIIEENAVCSNKDVVADILQNDISQTLAVVLLWIQSAREDKAIKDNEALQLAEKHLKQSIRRLVQLHYAILNE